MTDVDVRPARSRSNRGWLFAVIVLLILAALAIYFLSARETHQKHLKLALVTWTEDPFWDPLIRGAQDYAADNDVELTVIRSKPTVESQTQNLRSVLDSGVDGIAVSPNDATAERAILDEATGKVPVVTFDSDAPDTKRRHFVSVDNYAAGHFCADEVRGALPDGGPVLISVGSAAMPHGRDRRQGVIDGLLERGFERSRQPDPVDAPLKGPKYSIVGTVTDGADPTRAVATITEALRAHPEVKCVVGLFSYSAPAALQAIHNVGRDGQVQVVGFDDADETQAGIEAGTVHSSILQNSYRCGYETIEVLANEARGIPRGPTDNAVMLSVPIDVLTARNIADLRNWKQIRTPQNAGASPTSQPASQPAGH